MKTNKGTRRGKGGTYGWCGVGVFLPYIRESKISMDRVRLFFLKAASTPLPSPSPPPPVHPRCNLAVAIKKKKKGQRVNDIV